MSRKNNEKLSLGPFITTIVVIVIIVISIILAAISQTNGSVQLSTEEHAIDDMKDNSADYARSIWFDLENGITDLDLILNSDIFTYKIVFVTDSEGNILAKSDLAKYTVTGDNVFTHFSDGEYSGELEENDVRDALKKGETGSYAVTKGQKEHLVFRPLGDNGLCFFYMLHQGDVERIYSESEHYLKTVRLLGIAYVTATVGLVILMGSYIFHVAKTSESRLKLSNLTVRNAQDQVRTYSDITRVLSQSYERIYYVNLSNDRFRVFTSSLEDGQAPMRYEGEDFWENVCDRVIEDTVAEDKHRVSTFFNKRILPDIVREEGSKRIRFRMNVNGFDTYYSAKAYPSESDGQKYLIIGIKNVDAAVLHDAAQLAEKDAALRRLEIYRSALFDNMLACLEIDLTAGVLDEGPMIVEGKNELRHADIPELVPPYRFDDLAYVWRDHITSSEEDRAEFVRKNSCAYLKQEFENGRSLVELDYNSKWFDGSSRVIRQNYYMSKREKDGSIVALCVLYDMTEKISRDREIRQLTEELTQSRIKISTGQMQPHFLYNVLGSIREIILEDPQYASDLICDFTTHLRACIKSLSNDDLIPFSREVENVRAYVNIERMRFGDRMQVEFDIRYDDFDVVPLSIQPLVENAIRHGLYPKKDGMGTVKISTYAQNGSTVIVVKDNGVGFDYEKITEEVREHKRDSTGLLNLTLRLEKVMGAKVYFDSRIGEGTTVTVIIPGKKEGTDR